MLFVCTTFDRWHTYQKGYYKSFQITFINANIWSLFVSFISFYFWKLKFELFLFKKTFANYTQQISSRDRTEKVSQEKETKKQHYALHKITTSNLTRNWKFISKDYIFSSIPIYIYITKSYHINCNGMYQYKNLFRG